MEQVVEDLSLDDELEESLQIYRVGRPIIWCKDSLSSIDEILNEFPQLEVMLCGDLNRLDVSIVKKALSLTDLHGKPTYGEAQLDYILMSDSFAEKYTVTDS